PGTADMCAGTIIVRQLRAVDAQSALALYLHGPCRGAEIDGVATGARRLPADRAIAAHERHWLRRLDRELDCAAVAGAFEMHCAFLGGVAEMTRGQMCQRLLGMSGAAHAIVEDATDIVTSFGNGDLWYLDHFIPVLLVPLYQ